MRTPNLIDSLDFEELNNCHAKVGYLWQPARPKARKSFRLRCWLAWLVFTGQADALIWPGQ